MTPTFTYGGQSCSGTPQTFTITVNPSAQVNKPADQVQCNNASVPALDLPPPAPTAQPPMRTNSNTSIGLGASGSGNLPAFTATNSGTAPISATITVTPTFTNGGQSCSVRHRHSPSLLTLQLRSMILRIRFIAPAQMFRH
ncbi:MAG: hypothetical protein IPI74_03735 [Bacteroidales bacterium]|nr:hypothetical protein [Bacteroidales bacterium]